MVERFPRVGHGGELSKTASYFVLMCFVVNEMLLYYQVQALLTDSLFAELHNQHDRKTSTVNEMHVTVQALEITSPTWKYSSAAASRVLLC